MSNVLKVTNLKKSFRSRISMKKHQALKGITFELKEKRVTGFLGANGAGKTTTLKCALGFIYPDEGQIEFFGKGSISEEVKSKIGFLPERPYFYEYLTGREYLEFCAKLNRLWTKRELCARVDEILEQVELGHASSRALREYSKGMLQRIGLAQALIHKPEFIILDEPMSGLDPDGRFRVNAILRETAQRGTTVFFSSHLLHDAEALCQDLVIVAHGLVVYQGAMDDLLNRMNVGYQLTYRLKDLIKTEQRKTEKDLQFGIDEVRKLGGDILEVRIDRPSLESAFVSLTSGVAK